MGKKMEKLNGKIIVKLLVKKEDEQVYKIMEDSLTATRENAKLQFFLRLKKEEYYLFEQCFSKGVFLYFKNGIRLSQLKEYKGWKKNPRLDKTIEQRIPQCTRYIMREIA